MRLAWLPANLAWTFVIGDQLVRLDGFEMFFTSRRQAVKAAESKGFFVTKKGELL